MFLLATFYSNSFRLTQSVENELAVLLRNTALDAETCRIKDALSFTFLRNLYDHKIISNNNTSW